MARSVRIQYEGAVHHVMCRGDRREAIFSDDADRGMFLAALAEMCARTGMVVHSYVPMRNHYHLLLETPEGNLVAGMKWFHKKNQSAFCTYARTDPYFSISCFTLNMLEHLLSSAELLTGFNGFRAIGDLNICHHI